VQRRGFSALLNISSLLQNEQWVETDVDVARGVVEFSDPLTVEELEASRDQILAHLSNSCVSSIAAGAETLLLK
jgi:hypothetical protein